MDLILTDEQLLAQEAAREFADSVIAPYYEELETTNAMPEEIVRGLGECGFAGLAYDAEIGGAGADYLTFVVALELHLRLSSCPS